MSGGAGADEPGPPIARGRSADIYDLGDGTVLRRRRDGDVTAGEVAAMRLAAAHGYPVPRVHSVDGRDMVLDRVSGDDLLHQLLRRPWRAARIGRTLADLHLRLRSIPVDGGASPPLSTVLPAEVLVHGDLHPGNVIVTPDGPVVIDWEGALIGPRDGDAAIAWLLMDMAEVDDVPRLIRPIVGLVRRRLAASFVAAVGRPRPETVDTACDARMTDTNTRPAELEAIRRFRAAHGTGGDAGGDGPGPR